MSSLLSLEIINYNNTIINNINNNHKNNDKLLNYVKKNLYDISGNNFEYNINLYNEYKLNNFYFNPNKNSPPDEWCFRLESRIKKFKNNFL
tara:strand:- start:110 stop:382 length:273 start_codon:yes stop_codon:yes gene_type:complete